MELLKQELVNFKFKDITFFIRKKASLGDKLFVEALMTEALSAKSITQIPKIGKNLIRQFVCGWDGVTQDGKAVPYSYEILETGLPAELADELIPQLCQFVANNVDILKAGG